MRRESFDAVIDMICFNEADARSTVAAFKDNSAQIVICSSVAAYKRPTGVFQRWNRPSRSLMIRALTMPGTRHRWSVTWEKNRSQQLPVTIIRPSLTYGPGAANMGVLRQNYGIIEPYQKG